MPNPLHYGLDKRLREIADKFDNICRDHGLQYTIEADTHNEQGYLIHGKDVDNASVKMYMEDFLKGKWVGMEVEPNKHGSYFKFTVQPLYEYTNDVEYIDLTKLIEANEVALTSVNDYDNWLVALHTEEKINPIVISDNLRVVEGIGLLRALVDLNGIRGSGMAPVIKENQYKFPTSKHRRSQAPFSGSSNQPVKTFGGALSEELNVEYTLNKSLTAHDDVTIIPKGTKITIVDDDPELPDIKLEDGRILSVDMVELKSCVKEDLETRLDRMISETVVAIAAPQMIAPIGPTPFNAERGNMEAQFDPPGAEVSPMKSSPIVSRIGGALDKLASSFGIDIHLGGHDTGMTDTLNKLWAGEVAAFLQYELFYATAPSMHMASLQEVFSKHQDEERAHGRMLTKRIAELGGVPTGDLSELAKMSAFQVEKCMDAAGMISILRHQEHIAVDAYKAAIKQAADDPATRNMLEEILRDEEEHLSDMEAMLG